MPCCCISTLNLCNVPVCGVLEIKQAATAAESGSANVYTLVLDFLETTVTLIGLQTEGQNIKFNISRLNENFEYTGQLFDSSGELVSITIDDIIYDCIKFKTKVAVYASDGTDYDPIIPPVFDIPGTVVIEDVIGEDAVITGTTETVTGLTDGSNTITSNAFIGVRVIVIRGNVPIPGIDPGDGSNYFTKALGSDFISLNNPLYDGEFVRIQTIPE